MKRAIMLWFIEAKMLLGQIQHGAQLPSVSEVFAMEILKGVLKLSAISTE